MNRRPTSNKSGFVLISALIFLVVLTSLALLAMRGASLNERIATNERDQHLAREAAEMALRDAEQDLLGLRFDSRATDVTPTFCTATVKASCGGNLRPAGTRPTSTADAGNHWVLSNPLVPDTYMISLTDDDRPSSVDGLNLGIYGSQATTQCGRPLWEAADWDTDAPTEKCTDDSIVRTVIYGSFTGAPVDDTVIPTGVRLPRYLIEYFDQEEMGLKNSNKIMFRITAVGYGRLTNELGNRTSVTLQSVFAPL